MTHLKSNSTLKQGNVLVACEQPMRRTSSCTKGATKNNDDPTTRSSSQQWKTMKKNGNWNDASLKSTMESAEVGNNLQTIAQRWGVIVTSFHNHMYVITQSWKKEKHEFYKQKKVTLIEYVKKMQSITYPITLTYLQLKVAFGKINTFQEWHTWVGVVTVV